MKFAQFVKMALNMTVQYYNRFVKESRKDIKEEDIYIEHTIDNRDVFVCILYVKGSPDQKYVVSYDKEKKLVESYLTTKIDHLMDKKKEEVHA